MKDSYPPIVDKELWEVVWLKLERRQFFEKVRFTDAWKVHGHAVLHLQGDMWEMRNGVLTTDMDAERQEGQGMVVWEMLPAQGRGAIQERQLLREGFGESLPDGME